MPGFILNVHGLEMLIELLEGVTNTANRILAVLLENASPSRTGRIGIRAKQGRRSVSETTAFRCRLSILRCDSWEHRNRVPLILGFQEKGGAVFSQFTQ
jgi:hypothetical protein